MRAQKAGAWGVFKNSSILVMDRCINSIFHLIFIIMLSFLFGDPHRRVQTGVKSRRWKPCLFVRPPGIGIIPELTHDACLDDLQVYIIDEKAAGAIAMLLQLVQGLPAWAAESVVVAGAVICCLQPDDIGIKILFRAEVEAIAPGKP